MIERHAISHLKALGNTFEAVIVTGARQVGKTTLLQNFSSAKYISLDEVENLVLAKEEPRAFFGRYTPPIFIDEIQYAPNLFPYIKVQIDEQRAKRLHNEAIKKEVLFYLSGSQQFQLMNNVSESLAGRIGVMELYGLSLREIFKNGDTTAFLPTLEYLNAHSAVNAGYMDIWNVIWRGQFPQLWADLESDWKAFYSSYIKTYLERDVRDLTQVGNELLFMKFMTAVAARTGNLLNLTDISRDVGVSQPTAERWLSVLRASGLVYLLQPFYTNITKRAIKTPKLYFMDTGLACYLTGWNNVENLLNGAMSGAFFETFVFTEIFKSYVNSGSLMNQLYFYRDKDGNEIDLLIVRDGVVHPIEIKKHTNVTKKDISRFEHIEKISGFVRGEGGVVSLSDKVFPLNDKDSIIPVTML